MDSKEGVVYFSLGSVVKSSKMPKETVSLLLSELSKIEQTVLWKWESDDVPQLPKNVIIRKWFPQNDILGIYKFCTYYQTVLFFIINLSITNQAIHNIL